MSIFILNKVVPIFLLKRFMIWQQNGDDFQNILWIIYMYLNVTTKVHFSYNNEEMA